jgi:hypothetical protein
MLHACQYCYQQPVLVTSYVVCYLVTSVTACMCACRQGRTFGQYSYDTQQSREIYLTVLQGRGRMDAQVYALRTAMLFQPGAYRIVG